MTKGSSGDNPKKGGWGTLEKVAFGAIIIVILVLSLVASLVFVASKPIIIAPGPEPRPIAIGSLSESPANREVVRGYTEF